MAVRKKVGGYKGIYYRQVKRIGGKGAEYGAPELVTGGADGCVRIWDPRQDAPVVSLEPAESETVKPDCWAVHCLP